MKQLFKYTLAIGLVFMCVSVAFSGGAKKALPSDIGKARSQTTFTAGASNVDTLIYTREAGVSALSFFTQSIDSLSITRVTIRRIQNGDTVTQTATIDTLTAFNTLNGAPNVANPKTTRIAAVTLAPLAEQYWFIIQVAATAVGTTYTTYTAGVDKQYAYKP